MGSSPWDGVRNHEAKNQMRKMKVGDAVLFYHSNTKVPGIAGIAEVSREAYVDYTAFDATHPYHDAKSDRDAPRWYMVDVRFVRKFPRLIPLKELQNHAKEGVSPLKDMALIRRGRLSVQPVTKKELDFILGLADAEKDVEAEEDKDP